MRAKNPLRALFCSRILALAAGLGLACVPHPEGVKGQRLACYVAFERHATDIGPPPRGTWHGPAPRPRYCYEETIANVHRTLARHVDAHGICWLSVELIAARARVNQRTARRALGWLERLGWILRRERWRSTDHLPHIEPRTTLYLVLTRPLDPETIARVPSVLAELGSPDLDEQLDEDLDEDLDPAPTPATPSSSTRTSTPATPSSSTRTSTPATPSSSSAPSTPSSSTSSSTPASSATVSPAVDGVQVALTALSRVADRGDELATPEHLDQVLEVGKACGKNGATIAAALDYVATLVRGRKLERVPLRRGELGEIIAREIRRERPIADAQPQARSAPLPPLEYKPKPPPVGDWAEIWKKGPPRAVIEAALEPTDDDQAALERLRALQSRGPP